MKDFLCSICGEQNPGFEAEDMPDGCLACLECFVTYRDKRNHPHNGPDKHTWVVAKTEIGLPHHG